jgi:hypothetical protein
MKTFMSIDEVFANYSDEWVLLDELETHDNLTVQGGTVVGHDSARSVVETMAIQMRLERCVIVCTKRDDAFGRDYAVSPITSFEEIEAVVAKIE